MAVLNKQLNFEVKQIGEPEDRVLRFIGSTETEDREGDVIEAAGWDVENYLKNPVFLFAHDYRQLPIGQSVNVEVDKNAKQLIFDIKFATADVYEFADTVYKLYLGGFMRAVSVGFIGKEWEDRYQQINENMTRWVGRTFKVQELLELSAVPVPCNPEAIQVARGMGILNGGFDKFFERGSNLANQNPDQGGQRTPVDIKRYLEAAKSVLPFIKDDLKEKGREALEQCGGVVADYDTQVLLVMNEANEVRTMTFDFLKAIEDANLKAGATLSKKNKAALQQAHDLIKGVIDSAGQEPEPEDDPPEGGENEPEDKGLPNTSADEFDLESIEHAHEDKDLDINPEDLQRAIKEVMQEKFGSL